MSAEPTMTAAEFLQQVERDIADSNDRIIAFDEAAAIREQACDDGKATIERAIEALTRPERFRGAHQVTGAYLLSIKGAA